MLEPTRNKAWLREAGLLLVFLIFLFSYSGKTILRTHTAPEKTKLQHKLTQTPLHAPNSNERFFQLKPRLFPITVPGNKNTAERPALLAKDSTQHPKIEPAEEQFVISSPIPWYQFYYFPGETDEYSLAG